jgi:hypothetical protein
MAKRLTPEQVGAIWILSGGPRDATADAISYAYVESGFETDAVSDAGAVGLWQGHPGREEYKNPFVVGRMAVAKYRDGGNSFVKHWDRWQAGGTSAKRLAYLPRAKLAAARVVRMNDTQLKRVVQAGIGPVPIPPINPLDLLPDNGPDLPDIPNPLEGLGEVASALGNVAELFRGFFEIWIDILRKIMDPDTWKDAGKVLLGFILLTIAVRRLFTVVT